MTKITAGELSQKAYNDTTKYKSMEVAVARTDEIGAELQKTILNHNPIFDMEEYFVGYVIAGDPLIKNLQRVHYYAYPHMPKPRPNQTIFLYNKVKDELVKRLWALPNAWTMACLSSMTVVDKKLKDMKNWSDAFFDGTFHPFIRKQHNINHLSESEYIELHREELVKAGCNPVDVPRSEPFDFSKVMPKKVVDPQEIIPNQDILYPAREA